MADVDAFEHFALRFADRAVADQRLPNRIAGGARDLPGPLAGQRGLRPVLQRAAGRGSGIDAAVTANVDVDADALVGTAAGDVATAAVYRSPASMFGAILLCDLARG